MKLLTHNMLASHVKGVTNGYPLKIEAKKARGAEEWGRGRRARAPPSHRPARRPSQPPPPFSQVEIVETDFDADFLKHVWARIDYPALVAGAAALGADPPLPPTATAADLDDPAFLRALHHALLEVCLEEGSLVCPETGRAFPVERGIPNMLLTEEET